MKEATRSDLNRILSKREISSVMTIQPDDRSGFLLPFHVEATEICKQFAALFVFVEKESMQAYAIQDEGINIVAINAGMFWMLCRIASKVANSGVFPAMAGKDQAQWNPDIDKSINIPRMLLQEGNPFDWVNESSEWRNTPERQMLFLVTLSTLFRFVLFHEIGHLHNDHARRQAARSLSPMLVDAENSSVNNPQKSLQSQAREIIADGFALKNTIEILNRELAIKADLEMAQVLRNKLLVNKESLISFALTTIYLYFRILDKQNWQSASIDSLSHPPAPFRMKALLAVVLEHPPLNISNEAAEISVRNAAAVCEAVTSVVLEVCPKLHWFQDISSSEYDRHFERLYQEFPNWNGHMTGDTNQK